MSAVRIVRKPVAITVKGSIQPPRGTPGANGAYIVDLEVSVPLEQFADWLAETVRDLELGVVMHPADDSA